MSVDNWLSAPIHFLLSSETRVTRFGEFSPIGRLFSLGSFWKITEVATKMRATFFHVKMYALMLTKMGWAAFWAICWQTHLVTLPR
jgi:hypothetical protein